MLSTPRRIDIRTKGFTLLELSIVLVIIALVTGGIIAAKDIQRSSQLNDIIASTGEVRNAFQQFKDKFGYLPGDFPRATAIWGAAAGTTADGVDAVCDASITAATTSPAATCNGNGNGEIGDNDGQTAARPTELYRTWQHLANAGLIKGVYSGVSTSASGFSGAQSGTTVYGFKRPTTGMSVAFAQTLSADTSTAWMTAGGNTLYIGGDSSGSSTLTKPATSPLESYRMDVKIDDGRPATGVLTTQGNFNYFGSSSYCIAATAGERAAPANGANAGNNSSSAQYDISNDSLDTSSSSGGCALKFDLQM